MEILEFIEKECYDEKTRLLYIPKKWVIYNVDEFIKLFNDFISSHRIPLPVHMDTKEDLISDFDKLRVRSSEKLLEETKRNHRQEYNSHLL